MDRHEGHTVVAKAHAENLPMLRNRNSPSPADLAMDDLPGALVGRGQLHRSYYKRRNGNELNTGNAAVLGQTRTTMTNERAPI